MTVQFDLWNIKTGKRIRILNEEPHIASSVTFSQDSSILAFRTHDSTIGATIIRLWNTITGEQIRILEGDAGNVSSMVFSPENRTIAGIGNYGSKLWDVKTGKLRAEALMDV